MGFEKTVMVLREISFIPGLFKIFDKILVYAARRQTRDLFKVNIDPDLNNISVYYTGEANAGDLLLDDLIEKKEFVYEVNSSTEFFIEYTANESRKRYEMEVKQNMLSTNSPVLTTCKINDD